MSLYAKYLAMHLQCQMQYKLSFFLTVFGQFLTSFTTLLGVWFMFLRFLTVEGFTLPQVLLCFASVLMAFSLSECFARGFDVFPRILGNGEFDRVLVRPRPVVLQILASKVEFSRLGRLVQAILVFAYAIPTSGVNWTWDKVITLVLMVSCGTIIFFCLFLIYATIAFFTVEGLEFMNIFTDGGREFGRYPYSIYGKQVLRFVTYIIPLALFQYYPLLYLLEVENSCFYMLMPVLGLGFTIPAYTFWRFGLSKYKSTGS